MSSVVILVIGTGTIAGIIKNSTLKNIILEGLKAVHISDKLIPTISGALMSGASASTTAGAILTSTTFSDAILATGVGSSCD